MQQRAKPGRPRRVDVDAIVDATLAIGLEHATVQNVAARVGVSSQALYQYVAGRDELLRLAGQRAFARMDEVVDRDQHWATYLRESAEAVRRVIIDNPQLVALNLAGLISDQEVLLRSGAAMEASRLGIAVVIDALVSIVGAACALQCAPPIRTSAGGASASHFLSPPIYRGSPQARARPASLRTGGEVKPPPLDLRLQSAHVRQQPLRSGRFGRPHFFVALYATRVKTRRRT